MSRTINVDFMDEIPALMKEINTSPASPRRFRGISGNSYNVTMLLNSDVKDNNHLSHTSVMARQASKVLEGLSKIAVSEKKSIEDIASVARERIEKNSYGDNNMFQNYDIDRRGRVTHHDFRTALLSTTKSTSLNKQDVKLLTSMLDKNNTGLINYIDISKSLHQLEAGNCKIVANSGDKLFGDVGKETIDCGATTPPVTDDPSSWRTQEVSGYERAFMMGLKQTASVTKPHPNQGKDRGGDSNSNRADGDMYSGPALRVRIGHAPVLRNSESADFQKIVLPGRHNYPYLHCDGDSLSPHKDFAVDFETAQPMNRQHGTQEGASFGERKLYHNESNNLGKVLAEKVQLQGGDGGGGGTLYRGNNLIGRNYETRAFRESFVDPCLRTHIPRRLRKRSASAPPRAGGPVQEEDDRHSMLQHLKQQTDGSSGASPPKKPSASKSQTQQLKEYHQYYSSGVAEAMQCDNPPKATQSERSPWRQTAIAYDHKFTMNTLLSQINSTGSFNVMQFRLKNKDTSQSGFVNRNEFSTVLASCGVNLPVSSMNGLFEYAASKNSAASSASVLSSLPHDADPKAVFIDDFVQSLRVRSSATATAARSQFQGGTATPLEAQDKVLWDKVVKAVKEPIAYSKSAKSFLKEAQIVNGNKISSVALHKELNYLGSNLSQSEFTNLAATLSTDRDGMINLESFTSKLQHKHEASLPASSTGLVLSPSRQQGQGQEAQHTLYSRNPSKKRHFAKNAQSNVLSSHEVNGDVDNRLAALPSYMKAANSNILRHHRLRWGKLQSAINDRKENVVQACGGVEALNESMTPLKLRNSLFKAGVIVGDDDFAMLHSHVQSSKRNITDTHNSTQSISLGDLCDAIGFTVDANGKKTSVTSSREYEADEGIFSSSQGSILSNPTFRSSMITSSLDDTILVKGNRRRHATHDSVSSSDFWKFEHVPEMRLTDAPSHRQRVPLSQFLEDRSRLDRSQAWPSSTASEARSRSAPPRNRLVQSSLSKGEAKKSGVSRFASTPLANYILQHNNQRHDSDVESIRSRHTAESSNSYLFANYNENASNGNRLERSDKQVFSSSVQERDANYLAPMAERLGSLYSNNSSVNSLA